MISMVPLYDQIMIGLVEEPGKAFKSERDFVRMNKILARVPRSFALGAISLLQMAPFAPPVSLFTISNFRQTSRERSIFPLLQETKH